MLPDLPPTFAATRESLRSLACYAVSPARKARTGRIGLRAFGGGFATPPFADGTRYAVQGDELSRGPGDPTPITTVSAAATFLGIEASVDPGVGRDLPRFAPNADLAVDAAASLALGSWYAYAQRVVERVAALVAGEGATAGEAQLWPEHFDLAATIALPDDGGDVNVGFSPGDAFHGEPYVYVGPHDAIGLVGDFWNAPFGAYLPYDLLAAGADAEASALAFVAEGLDRAGLR
jgi:hypothetical protein